MIKLPNTERGARSFGDYHCLADAAAMIGRQLIGGWQDADLDQLGCARDEALQVEAWDRADATHKRLFEWLVGGRLQAFGQDDEGAFTELDRQRLSKPFFRIDIQRSRFTWAPDEWDTIFVSKRDLVQFLKTLAPSHPRKSITYDWCEISCLAWQLALDDPAIRRQSALIAAVQDRYHLEHDQHPDEKELRKLAQAIISHLGDQILSRDVSSLEAPQEAQSE